MPTPLSPNTYPEGLWREGYKICLEFESKAISTPLPSSDPSCLVCARFLGYMILEAPTDHGRDNISRQIIDCVDEDEQVELMKFCIGHLVRFRTRVENHTSSPSEYISRPSLTDEQCMQDSLHEGPQFHAKAKEMALFRDGYRCVLTGICDTTSYIHNEEVRTACDMRYYANIEGARKTNIRIKPTLLAHIFPEATSAWALGKSQGGDKHQYAATVPMQRYGEGSIQEEEEFDGSMVHCMENVMTLSIDAHYLFNKLQLWLEELLTPHTYRVKAVFPVRYLGIPEIVTFTTPDSVHLPLPSPRCLYLHAVCARVVQLSGAGPYMQTILQDMDDMDDMCALESDGSSADVLEFSLMKLQ
ncbi:hypothetical protein M405DRAFT_747326 [Rhizopogon salebrosus TDB-379]|nr:hypothetical protein M405DRAFT_747326 [Rhizopogon salebrosus TDB-379]